MNPLNEQLRSIRIQKNIMINHLNEVDEIDKPKINRIIDKLSDEETKILQTMGVKE